MFFVIYKIHAVFLCYYYTVRKKVHRYLLGVFLLLVILLFWWTTPHYAKPGTVKIWDKHGTLLYESAEEVGSKQIVHFAELPRSVVDAITAAEDQTFWENPGVDGKAILRSLYINLKEGRIVTGASTITQQVARLSFISSYSFHSRSYLGKLREILTALRITATSSKKEILVRYLNNVYFGNLSYGIKAAAESYFGKDVSQLSLAQAALLSGLIRSPDILNPLSNPLGAKEEQEKVLALMLKNNLVTKEQYNLAIKEQLVYKSSKQSLKAPHFVHFVLDDLAKKGISTEGGINVYTTLDYSLFRLSEEIGRHYVSELKEEHDLSNASLILEENKTGRILVMLGGIDYSDIRHQGAVNMTTALRQPGSALKPITYAAAFMRGYTPATVIYDVKKVYTTKKGDGFTPNNYDGVFHGIVLAREALASSLNLPAVEMLSRIGIPAFLQLSRAMGIETFLDEDRYDLSITLGGAEVRLLDLTNVYATFARQGDFIHPYAIEKVIRDNGEKLFAHHQEKEKQVLGNNGKQIAYLITDILSDKKARMLGFSEKNPLVLSRPAAVKTGTTTDWHDNWTVGYSPSYTVGVWVGNNDNHPMKDITGVVGAAPIWHRFFEELMKETPEEKFSEPQNITETMICQTTGMLPDPLCPRILREKFIDGTEPKRIVAIYKNVAIDTRNNLLASSDCPKEYVKNEVLANYPPEVYSWAVANDQPVLPKDFSPLCASTQSSSGLEYIAITSPRRNAVFESAPQLVANEGIVFEVNVSSSIRSVIWFVDGKRYKEMTSPFSVSWRPVLGKHTVYAVGENKIGETVKTEVIPFSILDYKADQE